MALRHLSTFTGKAVDPTKLRADDISIYDIAHGLSNLCRYAGQCPEFLSVAQHSILVAYELEQRFGPKVALWGLLHDASEAYLCDLPTMIKKRLPTYRLFERRAHRAIAKHYGLPKNFAEDKRVKAVDISIRKTECFEKPINPLRAERLFTRWFRRLIVHA